MQVLHLTFWDHSFWLWAEDSERTADCKAIPGPAPDAPYHHPFSSPPGDLQETLELLPVTRAEENSDTICIRIPACLNIPFASHPILTPPIDVRRKPILTTFEVDAYRLSMESVLELVATSSHTIPIQPGLLVGQEFDWTYRLLRLAADLAIQQSVLPTLVKAGPRVWQARWTPILLEDTQAHCQQLAACLPQILRCATAPKHQEALAIAPGRFVHSLLDHCADWFMRIGPEDEPGEPPATPHEGWVQALESADPSVPWQNQSDLEQLAQQIESWRRPADLQSRAPFRIRFHLEEPEDPDPDGPAAFATDQPWNVRCLLQSKEDPSIQAPIGELLASSRKATQLFSADPLEYLLFSMGQIAGFFPQLKARLDKGIPESIPLDTRGAYQFLQEIAPALQASGFGVVLPNWWRHKRNRSGIGLGLSTKDALSHDEFSIHNLFQCQFHVTSHGTPLSLADLEGIARLKLPLVRMRGMWVEVDQAQIQKAIALLREKGEPALALRGTQLLRIGLGADQLVHGLPVQELHADGWLQELLDELKSEPGQHLLTPPKGLKGTLRPYQVRGYSWLAFLKRWGLGACLADDMGLGKTIQTLALLEADRRHTSNRPTLLVCPTSVVFNWKKEAERFTPKLKIDIHHGPDRMRNGSFARWAQNKDLIITSFGLLHRDQTTLESVKWAGIVVDEAQNIKNRETKQTQAIKQLNADFRIALTGTPVENHIGELWSIMDFLNPDLLGSHKEFKERFQIPVQMFQDPIATERLRGIVSPFVMRRVKTDRSIISDLPEKLEMKDYCRLTKEQASLYASVLKDVEESLMESQGIQRQGLILATLTRLKQICNHPAHFLADQSKIDGRSGKLIRLQEMVQEFQEEGDQALIFTQYKEMGDLLVQHFQETLGCAVPFLHGSLPRNKRTELIEQFQNPSQHTPIFVLSLKAGGTGINLTRANRVVHFDRWWNPAVENQATDRAFRIGQTQRVMVHKFICAGTMEERIDQMIDRKAELAAQVVQSGERWISELSNQELQSLWALDPEAVGD
jgi:superfamily II DNA or RNA helicase